MKKPFISPEVAKKLVAKGYLSQEVANMACGGKVKNYAEGGPVQPLPMQGLNDAQRLEAMKLANQPDAPEINQIISQMQPQVEQQPQVPMTSNDGMGEEVASILASDLKKQAQPQVQMPNAMGIAQSGYNKMQSALEQQARIGAEAASAEAGYYNQMADEVAKANAQRQERQLEYDKTIADRTAKLDAEVAKVAEMQVDPNRFFKNASTGQKVGMLVGVLLGGLNPQGQNQALAALYNVVNQDIEAQKNDIVLKKDALSEQKGIISEMRKNFESKSEAENAAKIATIDMIKMKMQAEASRYNNPLIMARAQEAIGKLDLERAKLLGEYQKTAAVEAGFKDEQLARIQKLPENLRGSALKEYQEYKDFKAQEKAFTNAAQDLVKNRAELVGKNKVAYEASRKNLESMAKSFGLNEKQVAEYLPGFTDSKAEAETRIKKFEQLLKSKKDFPVLKGTGIVNEITSFGAPVRSK